MQVTRRDLKVEARQVIFNTLKSEEKCLRLKTVSDIVMS